MTSISSYTSTLSHNIKKVIIGKDDIIELLLVSLLCEGHILLEDVPGVGKTMLARALAASIGGVFRRVQCTPDLLPNDITGVSVFNQQTSSFEFRPGPLFVNILLADEINRATPRTQSALLEAMQEQQVTVDGITYRLPRPFIVMATQNPIEYEGTFPLPEAQLDRFMMRLSVGYPSTDEERLILKTLQREHPINTLGKVVEADDIVPFQKQVWEVNVDETVQEYILKMVALTRAHTELTLGASPRASLALFKAGQALAALRGRDHVIPDDIKYLAEPILAHRLMVRPEAELKGRSDKVIVREIVASTPLGLRTAQEAAR
ncbi:MAG TPA: MoxR family ATPase [Anaerolineaceae bacterium]|nr:MoxR family ATPase [Anaerolineaceae bacterium]